MKHHFKYRAGVCFGFVLFLLYVGNSFAFAEVPVDPDLVVFLSDSHIIGTQPRLERAAKTLAYGDEERLAAVCRSIVQMNPRPACVIHLGDFVSRPSHREAYEEAKRILKILDDAKIPWYLVPGNHDKVDQFEDVFPGKKQTPRIVPNRYAAIVPMPHADLICLDAFSSQSRKISLGPEQQQWLLNELTRLRKAKRPYLVCAHHTPPSLTDFPPEATIGSDPLCRGFVHGHVHMWKVQRNQNGVPVIAIPSTGYSGGFPLGYAVLRLDRSGNYWFLKTSKPLLPQKNQMVFHPSPALVP